MFKQYFLNPSAQQTGEHEVHVEGCYYLYLIGHPIPLGSYLTCQDAVRTARNAGFIVDGCYTCCKECHTR